MQRAPHVRVYERRDELCAIGRDGAVRRFEGASAMLASILLEALREPRTREELHAHVASLAEDSSQSTAVVDQVLAAFDEAGLLATSEAREPPERTKKKIVLCLTGAVAVAHAPALVEMLLGRGFSVRIAATASAVRFVSPLALEALTHERVVVEPWPEDPKTSVPHLELARWADVVVVYPATATTISRIASGDCSSVVSAIAISTRAPVLVVPAMNEAMIDAPSVRRNVGQLQEDGFYVAVPSLGYEVAEPPEARKPSFGAAPPVQHVADIVTSLISGAR
jgi:hypothetical protein